jgi:hypothetical protein
VVLCTLYAGVLAAGLATLPSSQHQIQQPWLTLMEVLIIAIGPAMVALTVGLHGWAAPLRKPFAVASIAFMSMCAALTCAVHFTILTIGRHPAFADQGWARLAFSFEWPSVAYALDILAWDVFFALAALFAALAVGGYGLAATVRRLLFASAALAFAGLAGVALGNMQIRNVGIIGYAVAFPVAAAFMARLFQRS